MKHVFRFIGYNALGFGVYGMASIVWALLYHNISGIPYWVNNCFNFLEWLA